MSLLNSSLLKSILCHFLEMSLESFLIKNNILCFDTLESMDILVYATKSGVFLSKINDTDENKINNSINIYDKPISALKIYDNVSDVLVFIASGKDLSSISLFRNKHQVKKQTTLKSDITSLKVQGQSIYILAKDLYQIKIFTKDETQQVIRIEEDISAFEVLEGGNIAFGRQNVVTYLNNPIFVDEFTPIEMIKTSNDEVVCIGESRTTRCYAILDLSSQSISKLIPIKASDDNKKYIFTINNGNYEYIIQSKYIIPKKSRKFNFSGMKTFSFNLTSGFKSGPSDESIRLTKPSRDSELFNNYSILSRIPMPNPKSYNMYKEKIDTFIASKSYIEQIDETKSEIEQFLNEKRNESIEIYNSIAQESVNIGSKIEKLVPKKATLPKKEEAEPPKLKIKSTMKNMKFKKKSAKFTTDTEI